MEKTIDITAMGELLIDFAEYGTSEYGNRLLEVCPGGAPCNMLSMASRLGKKTAFIGKVGNDNFGRFLRKTIVSTGIDDTGLLTDDKAPTTLAFVHTLEGGEREFSFCRNGSADTMLKAEELKTDLIKSSRVFHFGTLSMTDEPVLSATKKALETAKESGCIISFDPNLRPPLWKSLDDARAAMEYGFERCDILKIADNEVEFITGTCDYDAGISRIIQKYDIPLVFLTMGKNGSRAYYKGLRIEADGFKVNSIEATGAGDCFCASAVCRVLDRGPDNLSAEMLKDILVFANAAAAIVTTRKGAILSMPTEDEVLTLLEENR